ncbi:hypothetical protein [Mesoterricola silvestris]|uniref:hypothetical protein n=1 Tax=Mesoterricola silvestris TaxID=2927979 RepID=UPI002930AC0C|nr:hypothetical protein [Mesoterricola silvestris]
MTRIQEDASGEALEFTYGKAPHVNFPGPEGTVPCAPTVLTGIRTPGRDLRLDWEDAPTDEGWAYGVRAVRETGVPAYSREPAGGGPQARGLPMAWTRHFRHFLTGAGPDGCRTYARDRWLLSSAAPEEPVPTLAWDGNALDLVPVPGRLTRWDSARAGDPMPALHTPVPAGFPCGGGLRGGADRGPWPGRIRYNPVTHEVEMEAFQGHLYPVGSASGAVPAPGTSGSDIVAQEIARTAARSRAVTDQIYADAERAHRQAAILGAQAMAAQDAARAQVFAGMAERARQRDQAFQAQAHQEMAAAVLQAQEEARQAQARQDPTYVYWLSRDVQAEGKLRGIHVFQHSQLVFTNSRETYVVESGPDSNGMNVAYLNDKKADTTAFVALGILPPNMGKADISALVNAWNANGHKYFPVDGNCNTFSVYMWEKMGFSPVDLGLLYPH